MALLADRVDGVIGVDTHRDTLTAAAVTAVGGLLGQLVVTADAAGYEGLLSLPARMFPAGDASPSRARAAWHRADALLIERGEWVVEVDRPSRPARRGGKSDTLDAVRASRAALGQQRPARPRRRGDRDALRVLLATRHGALVARTCAINQLRP